MNTDIVFTVFQDLVFFILVIGIGYLFGRVFYKIYLGEPVFTKKASRSLEGFLFLLMGVDPEEKMTIKTYI
ncbi:MAG: potassium-transporting ATPase subunit KdpA, partial [Bacilli bacterium]